MPPPALPPASLSPARQKPPVEQAPTRRDEQRGNSSPSAHWRGASRGWNKGPAQSILHGIGGRVLRARALTTAAPGCRSVAPRDEPPRSPDGLLPEPFAFFGGWLRLARIP